LIGEPKKNQAEINFRKFDGDVLRLNEGKGLSVLYSGGLSCSNPINSPSHEQLENAIGDTAPLDESNFG
jgi:hypothetical protein